MSCYEWERGTIVLPSAAVKPVRDAVIAAQNGRHDRVRALAKEFWALHHTSSRKNLDEVLDVYPRTGQRLPWGYEWDRYGGCELVSLEHEDTLDLFRYMGEPHSPTVADVDRTVGAKATNRTNVFKCGEASITFDGRKVTWGVPENNHACETAREHPLAVAFFRQLRKVTWTRGSGGRIVGNNEYSRGSEEAGGGANYVVEEFGPKVRRPVRQFSYR